MRRILIFSLAIIALGFLVSLLIYFSSRGSGKKEKVNPSVASTETEKTQQEMNTEKVKLFFPTYEGYLLSIDREISVSETDIERAEKILDALKTPPPGAQSPFPVGASVRRIYIVGKEAVVDLALPSERTGTTHELLVIYSFVNSLSYNIDGVEEVKIVVGGIERKTLYGHISLKYPFYPDLSYAGE